MNEHFPFNIILDACALNPPQSEEKMSISELGTYYQNESVDFVIPKTAREEALRAPFDWIKQLCNDFIYTIEVTQNEKEHETKYKIRKILFGDGDIRPKDHNDVDNIFEAQKYGGYFVTLDKKYLLSKADILKKHFNLRVLSPSECLKEIREWFSMSNGGN